MVKLNLYTAKGTKKSSISLPKRFQEEVNLPLLAQAIRVYEAGKHPGLSKTKTRGEVRASTRKIWRQKGTGRARHGAVSAPIFVGGGVTHGPKGIKRELTLPKKMRQKALKVALTLKTKSGEVVLVDGLSTLTKTKDAEHFLNKVRSSEKKTEDKKRFTFVLSKANSGAKLALRNLENVGVVQFVNLNAHNVYFGGVLIVDKEALAQKQKKDAKTQKVKKSNTKTGKTRKSTKK